MKIFSLIFFLLFSLVPVWSRAEPWVDDPWAGPPLPAAPEPQEGTWIPAEPGAPTLGAPAVSGLSRVDEYQAEQWLRLMKSLWQVGDYPTMKYYARKIVEYYPGTSYAAKAEMLLVKSEKPSNMKKFIQANPGLFPY